MYSGSCDSIRSNGTIQGKSSSESSTDTEHDSSDEETEEEEFAVDNIPSDSPAKVVVAEQTDLNQNSSTVIKQNANTEVNTLEVNNHEEFKEKSSERLIPIVVEAPTVPCDMLSGAATASEIFRHLQATRGKQEVTTELAKILTVLKSTLNGDDKDSSSSEDESPTQDDKMSNPIPTGKPPKPPQKIKFSKNSVISPAIQARIRDLEANKPGNPKEEMNLLSKILVHLLCSCKTPAAAQELKRIIRQFKEVAKAAMEEGDDVLESLRSSSRASSRSSKRRARSRTASGNSNISGNSETDSMNTLTPGDSKSSGTDDETNQESNVGKIRFTSNVNMDKGTESHSCVSYTLTLPLKKEEEEEEEEYEEDEEEYEDDEEWEWEYEDELESSTPTKAQNDSSGSSRNQTPSEAKSDHSSGSTRKILNDMELGAYNTNSDPSNSNSHSTPITEEDDGLLLDDDDEAKNEKLKKKMVEKSESSEHLFSHLEETFKVLSDTYKIITTGNSPDCDINAQSQSMHPEQGGSEKSFEDILDGVSSQCVQLESEIMRSSRQSTATPECSKQVIQQSASRPASRSGSRANSRMSSRPASRNKIKTPVPQQAEEEEAYDGNEEDWDDEDGWEYYYEEDYEQEEVEEPNGAPSRPASKILMRSRPASRQEIAEYKASRPASRQEEKVETRPSSRIVKRPASRSSRPASRAVSRCSTMKQEDDADEEEDWGDDDEWEYYYEEELPENEPPKVQSRPASRQKQASRASSRQDVEIKRGPSRNSSRVPSRANSRPASRAKSSAKGEEHEDDEDGWEYYYEEDEDESANHSATTIVPPQIKIESGQVTIPINRVASRPNSRQSNAPSRPTSRSGSRPVSRASSRPGSRAASRLKRTTSALGNVEEEDEYEWYYEDGDDPELTRLSPTLTTAPTTRATSPFPDEKGKVEQNTGTGFSKRRMSAIIESEETTPVPSSRTPTNRGQSATPTRDRRTATPNQDRKTATPSQDRRTVMSKTPTAMQTGFLNPMAGVSVCLAAEYLGQDAQQLAASLPVNFIEENQVIVEKKKKHKHKHRSKDKDSDNNNDESEEKKKRKKKKDGKFLPKVGVKELASRLEPQLFQDMQAGNKMVISREEAKGIIQENKKRPNHLNFESERGSVMSPAGNKSEDKRKSVREMVELMSNQNLGMENISESNSPPQHIPSISVSSQMVAPPIPPPPQAYYTSPNPQYPPTSYQPYPIEVHAHYSQYPPQSPHSPYQQYPPQSPYHQYPAQQYYQGYPPPPPPPQHYQQYPPQQYAQYHPQQMQSYAGYSQGYPPGPQQPMVYPSETNPNQVRVVSGGQTTVVNMRPKSSNSKQKEVSNSHKSAEAQRTSPNDSEAYGTGSTGSDQTEGQMAGIDHDEGKEAEEGVPGKPHKRHSRLFKLLQDSDYTDSDGDSRADYSRISMKNMEDNHSRESDIDSVCSGLERSGGVERKHSFRSHKSSNKESDNESVTSGGIERKISPTSVQNNMKHRRFMQLNLQNTYEPSSSELSTPNSPTGTGPDKRRSQSKPPSRALNYHADDFDSHAGVSDDSSYQSLQSLNSFDSMYDGIAGREVEEIMKKKVNRDSLYRYQTDSPSGYMLASPKGIDYLRGSPKTHSSSPKLDPFNRNSPKLEQELLELTNFPNSPGLSLRQLQSHRSFYGGK